MIGISSAGSFRKTLGFLGRLQSRDMYAGLERQAQAGVDALARNTPADSGATANAWSFEIEQSKDKVAIYWINNNNQSGVNIAVIIQYGHGTGTGGYVQGRDFINPAILPIFDRIAANVWREVSRA